MARRQASYVDFEQMLGLPCFMNTQGVLCKRTASVIIIRSTLGKPYATCLKHAIRYLTAAQGVEERERKLRREAKANLAATLAQDSTDERVTVVTQATHSSHAKHVQK